MFILHQQWFYIFRWWQMPLAATFLSGISAFHFRNCRSLDKLWFVPVGPASFKYGRAVEFETLVTLCTLQESSFYSYPLLEFCFLSLSPCFLLPLSCSLVYPCIWLFKNSSALPSRGSQGPGIRDIFKKMICLNGSWTFASSFSQSCELTAVLNCVFNGPKNNSNSTQFIQGFQSRWNLYNPLVWLQCSKFESTFKPLHRACRSSGNHSQRL